MRNTRFAKAAVATTAATGMIMGAAAAASAATPRPASSPAAPTTLQTVKDQAHTAITDRVTKMHTAITEVNSRTFLGADQAALVSRMNNDITGLNQLDTTIAGDTTLQTARTDAAKIFTDYRIYALVLPSTHMVVAADAVQGVAVTQLSTAADRLQSLITKRGATGLQATLDDMKAQIAGARTVTAATSAHLQTLTPAEWNANHQLLNPDRANLTAARTDLAKARQDAKTIVAGLRKK